MINTHNPVISQVNVIRFQWTRQVTTDARSNVTTEVT